MDGPSALGHSPQRSDSLAPDPLPHPHPHPQPQPHRGDTSRRGGYGEAIGEGLSHPHPHRGEAIKRVLDLALSLCALVLLGLPFLIIALIIRIRLGSPVFFRAVRAGRWGKPFAVYKFRTMHNWRDEQGNLLPDEERITDLGRLLRRTSLDELPQLFNVIRGEMSLVGPRPLLLEYIDRYSPQQARRLEVRPGITGWAQINGRNVMSWEDKFRHDTWYVANISVLLDLRIMARTIFQVVRRHNVDDDGDLSVPIFMGSDEQVVADTVTKDA